MDATADGTSHDGASDPFDAVLQLEDGLYAEGYALGRHDGALAGRQEGRAVGLETGFDKFMEMGRLAGKAAVWTAVASRSRSTSVVPAVSSETENQANNAGLDSTEFDAQTMSVSRLQKHLQTLHDLTNPATLSTTNKASVVEDVDNRLKRAAAKARVVERILGEVTDGGTLQDPIMEDYGQQHV